MSYSSCPSHPVQQACRGCSMEDADHLIRKRLEAFKKNDLATRVAADIFGRWASTWADNLDIPDEFATDAADDSVRLGRIFAEAVAKEGK